jgi:hypothetical protein
MNSITPPPSPLQKGDKVLWNNLQWTCGKLNFKNQRKIFRKEKGMVKVEWVGEKFLKLSEKNEIIVDE